MLREDLGLELPELPEIDVQVLEDEKVVEVVEGGQVTRFSLDEDPREPGLLGWTADTGGEGPALEYPVTVSQVLEAAIRDWEAELVVFEHSTAVAEKVRARGGRWRTAARALADQVGTARALRLVPVRPFQERFVQLARRGQISYGELAVRLGWFKPDGRPDGCRVARRLGLVDQADSKHPGESKVNRTMSYATAEALWTAGLKPDTNVI